MMRVLRYSATLLCLLPSAAMTEGVSPSGPQARDDQRIGSVIGPTGAFSLHGPQGTLAGSGAAILADGAGNNATALPFASGFAAPGDIRSAGLKGDGTRESAAVLSRLFSAPGTFYVPAGAYDFPGGFRVPFGSRVTVDPQATVSSASSTTPLQIHSGPFGQPMPVWSDDSLTKTYGTRYQDYANVFTLFRAIVSNQTAPAVAIMGNANGGDDGTPNTHVWGANFAAGSRSDGTTSIATELDFGVLRGNGASIGLNVATNSYVDNLAGSMIRMQASTQGRTGHGLLFDGSTGGPQITTDLIKTTGGMNPATGIDLTLSNFSTAEISTPQFSVGPTPGVSFTGTTTAGRASVTAVTHATLLRVGAYIRGTGIPLNATITAIDTTRNTVTLSSAAAASGTAVSLFSPRPQSQVRVTGGGPQTSSTLGPAGFGGDAKANDALTVQSLGSGVMKMQTGNGNSRLALASNGSVDLGSGNVVAGSNSAGIGAQHALSGTSNVALGYGAADRGASGKVIISQGFFSARGDAQISAQAMRGSSGASTGLIQLTTNGTSLNATNSVPLPDNSAFLVYGWVVARNTGTGDAKAWFLDGALVIRGTGASSVTLVGGSDGFKAKGATGRAGAWTAALAADTKNGGIAVTAGGSTDLHISADIRTVEVQ